ncbi:MAG TPA: bifunctional glycosyltransferase/class I SAM-dependent methyltransferase [Candidatus Eremiobacteraeota bacterium]|nr:MAG: Undecaprenyl-phosphate mannosyltransferase [bacterium ADurb.Bin363]HPZ08395.1 bifunctional glycosyltransferase/class I SAM-dependent methyltransferase [Candidatus Eremiobacteraeota bacterium]
MEKNKVSLSVLVPVYNECFLVEMSIKRLLILKESPCLASVQIIIVDDCSNDGTTDVLNRLYKEFCSCNKDEFFEWIFLRHEKNQGKGKAIQTAIEKATCDLCIIHDADLEYNPKDILKMIPIFIEERADAVYGSRFLVGEYSRAFLFHHELGNKFLTFLCNLITNINLTDMESCYKAIRTPLLKSIPLESNDYCFEPEITIKLAKRGARIYQVPISYSGRDYQEGKKINWKDGVKALISMMKFWLSNKIYKEEQYGSLILNELSRAYGYNKWLADTIRPYVGQNVLEVGSGIGNITRLLLPRKSYYVTDVNPLYLHYLKNLQINKPYLKVAFFDVTDIDSFIPSAENEIIDTCICMNLLEHLDDDRKALLNIKSILSSGGKAIILVPNNPSIFGSIDEIVMHRRRYTISTLEDLLKDTGFEVENIFGMNRLGTIAWWFNGKVLKRKYFGNFQVWILNTITPLLKIVDPYLPLPHLSIIAIGKKV